MTLNLADRAALVKKRLVENEDGCWVWQGCRTSDGYGKITIAGEPHYAHRIMLAAYLGRELPHFLTLQTDHRCRERACCNPDHLELVTPQENADRARSVHVVVTSCRHGHEYTPENTRHYRGKKFCRQCDRDRRRPGVGS